jgi:hypothetical protein
VVIGPEAWTVVNRLRVVAADAGIRCIDFSANVFVSAPKYAAVMRDVARAAGCPVLHVPLLDDSAKEMIELADVVVQAAQGVGNRVWFVPRDGGGFSVLLPDLAPEMCRVATELLLAGLATLGNTHRAVPTLLLKVADVEAALRLIDPPVPGWPQPTHAGTSTRH